MADDGPGLHLYAERTAPAAGTADGDEVGVGVGLELAGRQAAELGIRIDRGDARLGGALFTITIPSDLVRPA